MHWSDRVDLDEHSWELYGEYLLSSFEVCRRARVTYRMLYSWATSGLVIPAVDSDGSGTVRRWWPYQVGEVIEIRELKREQRRLDDLVKRRRRTDG
jgi:DNA-binding transcriptional MerR regulator